MSLRGQIAARIRNFELEWLFCVYTVQYYSSELYSSLSFPVMQYNEGSWHNPAPVPGQTLTSTLANPYSQTALTDSSTLSMQYPYTVSSHYAQAYLPKQGGVPPHHPHGFGAARGSQLAPPSYSRQFRGGAPAASLGEARCTHEGCTFTGSQKTVEVHMMDRHLIYPKNWKEERHWDADPSLKG